MPTSFEELKILQIAESIADDIWRQISTWSAFARDVVGGQLARAMDSIGAIIAESFGRFHYGEKLQFLYYARGSLFEAKYWLNRSQNRELIAADEVMVYGTRLTDLARQLNAFASSLKTQRRDDAPQPKTKRIQETSIPYIARISEDTMEPLFSETDLHWLQSPISNL